MLIEIDCDTIKNTLAEYLDDGLLDALAVARALLHRMDAVQVKEVVNAQMWFPTWDEQEPDLDLCWQQGYDVAFEITLNEEREPSLDTCQDIYNYTSTLYRLDIDKSDERAMEAFYQGFRAGYTDGLYERGREEKW